MYDFDRYNPRKGTGSIKYDCAEKRGYPSDVLPLWVADMDFAVPGEIENALIEKSKHGIFGYTEPNNDYYNAVIGWFQRRYQFTIKKQEIITTPGVVFAINMALFAYTKKGDGVLIQKPVYYPFFKSIEKNGRRVVNNPLKNIDGRYEIDFEGFENKIIEEKVKLFILCSPHNPVGRVWTQEELEKMGDICLEHGVIVVADEIHCDFVYEPKVHIPFATVKEAYKDITITCTSPSKSFNLAGFQNSNIIISNKSLHSKMTEAIDRAGYSEIPVMGMVACQAAYEYGEPWLEELKGYLQGNLAFVRTYLADHLPKIKMVEPEGTYLIWLDFREYGMELKELEHLIIHEAKLWLDGGTMFGEEGALYQRINIATNREILIKAFDALKKALTRKS